MEKTSFLEREWEGYTVSETTHKVICLKLQQNGLKKQKESILKIGSPQCNLLRNND